MIEIKLEKFTGPLNLLLSLIEKEKMDITEINLANIANQYIEYIQKTEDIKAGELADFLVIATKLLLIKTKALLPYLFTQDEEDFSAEEFEEQLKIYKQYLDASKIIDNMIASKRIMFAREFNKRIILDYQEKFFFPPQSLTKDDLKKSFLNLLERIKPVEKKIEKKVFFEKISLEDRILIIKKMIESKVNFNFNKILEKSKSKTEVIVSFLAILELARQKEIVLVQGNLFSDIFINKYGD